MSIATSASLPALLFVSAAVLVVAGCDVSLSINDDTTRWTETEVVAVGTLDSIDVRTANGAVEIRGGEVDEVTVEANLQERRDGDADYAVDITDGELVLTGTCNGRVSIGCSVGFVVTVPSDFRVTVTSDNGRVEVFDIAGDVDAETDNGAIILERIGASVVDARSDNGRIFVAFVEPPTGVDISTDNGAIRVLLPDDGESYDVSTDSDNGSIRVDVPTDRVSTRRVSAESDNGSIVVANATS